jgi:AraC-like DNA-binding protein
LSRGVAGGQRERAVGEAINWIRTHYNEPLRIDALARTVHMSPSVLYRRLFGAPPLRMRSSCGGSRPRRVRELRSATIALA